jgi:CDP-diacylglycerol---glycerol-3-phosphate 3-phosphatidyltransferase
MSIPNILTSFRIFMIPLMIVVYFLPFTWNLTGTALIFAIAGWTDWLDGYIAREYKQGTAFGAFLDPVADKLLIVVSLVLVVEAHANIFVVSSAIVILGRELLVSALREWMSGMGRSEDVQVSQTGKYKTLSQMFALLLFLAHEPDPTIPAVQLAYILMSIAVVLTLWSMFEYLKAAWPSLTDTKMDAK